MADPQPDGRTLAQRLDHLFRTVHPRHRGPYSYAEVAKAMEERGGPTISATYIWQLRTGLRDNPTKRHLEALADFFGVSPAYFFDDAEAARVDARLLLLTMLRHTGARQIAARLPGLSANSIEVLAEMVAHLRQLEGLPDTAAGQAPPEQDPQAAKRRAPADDAEADASGDQVESS
jgi:transcriptional regulator with XRE-family HTH domain